VRRWWQELLRRGTVGGGTWSGLVVLWRWARGSRLDSHFVLRLPLSDRLINKLYSSLDSTEEVGITRTMKSLGSLRFLSSGRVCLSGPRFVETLKAGAKPPLEKPRAVTRPFGLDSPILLNRSVGDSFSLGNIRHELFSAEAKERRQKKLDHEITHSPFYETKSFRNTNGKIFTSPISYFKLDKAKYFPDFIGNTLAGTQTSLFDIIEGKVNIVTVFLTVSGENCVKTWFEEFNPSEKYPKLQIIDINIPQNWLKGFMIGLSKNLIKKTLPESRWGSYFVLPDHIWQYDTREKLLCDNMCSGYIYLVDHNGKIRWAASGYANEEEMKVFDKCLRGLQKELESLEK